MKRLSFFIIIFFLAVKLPAQKQLRVVFDTTDAAGLPDRGSYYYSMTDFSLVDSLEQWTYSIDTSFGKNWPSKVKPIALVEFWRVQPIDDSISKFIHGRLWTPRIRFEVYRLGDSLFCYKKSGNTRISSSCIPPQVGGDIIFVGQYIFLSKGVCLSCQRYDTKIDYCRPVVNQVLGSIDKRKKYSITELVRHFPLKPTKPGRTDLGD